jgi:hypothetical protein
MAESIIISSSSSSSSPIENCYNITKQNPFIVAEE